MAIRSEAASIWSRLVLHKSHFWCFDSNNRKFSAKLLVASVDHYLDRYFAIHLLAVGWIIKKLSKNKLGVFQVSRICWIVVPALLVLFAVVVHH